MFVPIAEDVQRVKERLVASGTVPEAHVCSAAAVCGCRSTPTLLQVNEHFVRNYSALLVSGRIRRVIPEPQELARRLRRAADALREVVDADGVKLWKESSEQQFAALLKHVENGCFRCVICEPFVERC